MRVFVILDDSDSKADRSVTLSFEKLPGPDELFEAFRNAIGAPELPPELRLYFRMQNPLGKYASVDRSYSSIPWETYDCADGSCVARLRFATPKTSPERPLVPQDKIDVESFHRFLRQNENLRAAAARLQKLSLERMHCPMLPYKEPDNEVTLEELGLRFPFVQLDSLGDRLIKNVVQSWVHYPFAAKTAIAGAARNVCVFAAGGASGTGKTRFGAALPQVLFSASQRVTPALPKELTYALQQCMDRQLVLQANLSIPLLTEKAIADMLLTAYFLPPSTASVPRFSNPVMPSDVDTIGGALQVIASTERSWKKFDAPIAVIIHFDEVQKLIHNGGDETTASEVLGSLVTAIANKWWQSEHRLFPIFYISGLSKTLVKRTKSCAPTISVNLPLLSSSHYTTILRQLFGFPQDSWIPDPSLLHALRCIEGPPRILLLFLWAVVANGSPSDHDLVGQTVDYPLLKQYIGSFTTKSRASAVLHRCIAALPQSRLVTFTDNVMHGAEKLQLFNHIAALVLLREAVGLQTKLTDSITVNEAITRGLAFAQPSDDADMCYLYWPRIYIYALAKWCGSTIDGLPIHLPKAAATPSPVMHSEDAWRYNEDADIKLVCLRLFALVQHAHQLHQNTTLSLPLERLLQCMMGPELAALQVRLPTAHVPRAEVLPEPINAKTLMDIIANKQLPFAASNKEKTSYADSILVLKLDKKAPLACCPATIGNERGTAPSYKKIPKEYENTLAVLIQSKFHKSPQDAASVNFTLEYWKCIDTPIPFVFVLVSDTGASFQQHLGFPYNGNGFLVGPNDLQRFYGEFLYKIRSEEW